MAILNDVTSKEYATKKLQEYGRRKLTQLLAEFNWSEEVDLYRLFTMPKVYAKQFAKYSDGTDRYLSGTWFVTKSRKLKENAGKGMCDLLKLLGTILQPWIYFRYTLF